MCQPLASQYHVLDASTNIDAALLNVEPKPLVSAARGADPNALGALELDAPKLEPLELGAPNVPGDVLNELALDAPPLVLRGPNVPGTVPNGLDPNAPKRLGGFGNAANAGAIDGAAEPKPPVDVDVDDATAADADVAPPALL